MEAEKEYSHKLLRRTFSFRKVSKGFSKYGRHAGKKPNKKFKDSANTTNLYKHRDLWDRSLDQTDGTKSHTRGHLKRSSSLRKSFSSHLKSLPSFRQKFRSTNTKVDSWEGSTTTHDRITSALDQIGQKSWKGMNFRKRILRRFRSQRNVSRKEHVINDGKTKLRRRITYVDIVKGETNCNIRNAQKCSSGNMTLTLKSGLTSLSEQVDLTDLITPVVFCSGNSKVPKIQVTDNQKRTPKEKPKTSDRLAPLDFSDSNNTGFLYQDTGEVAIAECSPTLSAVSPTCADIYGQDEGVDLSFTLSHDEAMPHDQITSHNQILLKDQIATMENEVVTLTSKKNMHDLDIKARNQVIESLSGSDNDSGNMDNINNMNIKQKDHDTNGNNTLKKHEQLNCDVDKSTSQQSHDSIKEELANVLKQDNSLQIKDIKTDTTDNLVGYDEVDNPWVLRTDVLDLQGKRMEPSLKPRNFISEYSVDDSLGFNVNEWNNTDFNYRDRKSDTKDILVGGGVGKLARSDSVESMDSFSSSIHSAHSEDLFFSASEPEMEPDQMSISSGDLSPLDKPKLLLKIDEADEQTSPVLKKQGSSENIKLNTDTDLTVKSLNDLNRCDSSATSTPRKISSYLHGLKSLSFESGDKNKANKHEKLKQRRSLDSNLKIQQMCLDLNMNESPAVKNKLTSSTDSGLSAVLSPVAEKPNKSAKKSRRRTVDVGGDDDSVRFFTLPARRKVKSDAQDSPRRKVTRISSISKLFSDKAQSLSNIKLGSSFKLRNTDGEKSKVPSFLKTTSLTNLMARKGAEMASSISTLIRGRSNSNTVMNSPFKQKEKVKETNQDDKTELLYERVRVPCARKRPATTEEIAAWKKRLTLNVELANSLKAEDTMRLRADSFVRKPHWSGSENGSIGVLRSPTLLDEIMKSVDNTRFRSLGSPVDLNFDLEDSDDGDSSNEGTSFVFRNQMVGNSGTVSNIPFKQNSQFGICYKCGHVTCASDANKLDLSKQGEFQVNGKLSLSVCDLSKKCKCSDSQFQKSLHYRHNPKRNSYNSENESSVTSPQSSEVSEASSSGESPNSNELSDIQHSTFASMFELRDFQTGSPVSLTHLKNEHDEEIGENITSSPGSLLRHRPVLDLSADNLDVTDETDSGVVMCDTDRQTRERRSQSCDDITNCDKTTPDGENFYSCSDMTEAEIQKSSHESHLIVPATKSHSCDDILNESEGILIDSGLKNEERSQHRKEVRKAKVKSLSSSHDALSMLVHVECLNIDNDPSEGKTRDVEDEITVQLLNEKKDIPESQNKTFENNLQDKPPVCDTFNKAKPEHIFQNDESCKNSSTELQTSKSIVNPVVTEDLNHFVQTRQRTLSERLDRVGTLSAKPPLPRKTHRKVLSVSDIRTHSEKHMPSSMPNHKRFSMIEMSRKDSAESLYNVECKTKQNEKLDIKKVDKLTVKSQSCDYINLSDSASTPKNTNDTTKFLFDEEHIQSLTLKIPETQNKHTLTQKSVSSGNVPKDSFDSQLSSNSSYSMFSLNRLSNQSISDDVFQRLSSISPPQPCHSPPEKLLNLDGFIDFSNANEDFSRFSDLPTPDVFPEPDLDSVLKYDVCLGYLLHSVQCDNRIVCFYSFQRNKQLMESVITPLAILPGVISKQSNESNHISAPKQPSKAKCEDLPNPAAPITSVPSDRLLHAGQVLRTVLLARAPHMIRDRKFHLRTYRRCMVGTEMVDWLMQQCTLVHSRNQAVGMWQALVEEGVVVHVCHEHQFKDKYLFYRFHEDDEGVSTVPSNASKRECEEELQEMFLMMAQIGPDAMMRMILRKLPHERTVEDLEIIYEELLHIKALSHLSTMVKRELASVLVFESHAKSGTVLFNQGDEGKSWYIILKGSVNVVIYGKGVVCTLHEGDDFGKLALVNDAPRAATIVLRDDNCHFLRVDKDDFNRILRDVEANTVRLKEHGHDVLVLEKIPSNTQTSDGTVHAHYKYSVMAGTPEKMLEHLLETRLDNKKEDEIDGFLEDFILTHVIFMPCNHLCPVLLSHYHSSATETTEQEAFEFMFNHKKCVLHFVQEWGHIMGPAFREDHTINAFLEELHSCVLDDLVSYPSLRDDLVTLETVLQAQTEIAEGKSKKRASGNFTLSRKTSKDTAQEHHCKRKSIMATDENIFKVYCADHTYSTLKLSMDTTVEKLLMNTKEKLGLGDDLILCEVKSSGERVIFKENDLCVTSGLSINGRLFVTPKEHLDALTPLPEQEGPSEGTFTTIEMFSSKEMAYFMTLYDWELFTAVQEYELIFQVFGRYKFQKITANLDLFLRRFNEIQFWVVTEMVLTTNLSKRVALLRKFIKLAAHCKENQNLNSFFAVVMGLSNIAVSRLSQTWEKLPSKFKKMFVEFETLMDPSRNHRVYRLTVAKMAPPILPFMPLLMKDMTFTHEGNKTYFDGLVNFEKMRMISQTLKTVRFCRRENIDLETPGTTKSGDAMSYIRNLHVIDNQRLLTQLSHKLEPRKT